jgi:hypothetical protein
VRSGCNFCMTRASRSISGVASAFLPTTAVRAASRSRSR